MPDEGVALRAVGADSDDRVARVLRPAAPTTCAPHRPARPGATLPRRCWCSMQTMPSRALSLLRVRGGAWG